MKLNYKSKSQQLVAKDVDNILKKPYARRLIPDESGGYVASIHEFPGCIADGDTAKQALNNLERAAAAWLASALSSGYPVREPVDFYGYSGKIALRIPRGLHKQIAELAELEGVSINQLLNTSISEYVSQRNSFLSLSRIFCQEMRNIISDGLIDLLKTGPASVTISFNSNTPMREIAGTTIDGLLTEKTFDMSATKMQLAS